MTHEECISTVLRSLGEAVGPGAGLGPVQEHVADCSDCWKVVSLLFEIATGVPPAEADRMEVLYGCEEVQGQLFGLVGLRGDEVGRRYPEVARHLAWCFGCRERLVEILQVEEAASRGEFGPLVSLAAPSWKQTVNVVGETIRELVGRVVVQVQGGVAVLTTLPPGLVVAAVPATSGLRRGSSRSTSESSNAIRARQVELGLGESGLSADLTFYAQSPPRIGIALRIVGASAEPLMASLRAAGTESAELLAAHTVRGQDPIHLGDLPPGDYVLEIRERAQNLRFRVALAIDRGE